MRTDTYRLNTTYLGTERVLTVRRYGTEGDRPKAYLQAALHADELPGIPALHYLEDKLAAAEDAGDIRGEIVVVPIANPIGLAQMVHGVQLGRFDLDGRGNFNRQHPDVTADLLAALDGKIGADPGANLAVIRAAMVDSAKAGLADAGAETDHLRRLLYALACDADIVLDLHCDWDAAVHLYLSDGNWPDGADLSAQIGSRTTLIAAVSGDNPFDEAFSRPWNALREVYGDRVPMGCLSGTVELRGDTDVSDDLARADADNLYKFVQRRGLIDGDPGVLPDPLCEAVPLTGLDNLRSPIAGIVTFTTEIGATVNKGQVVAYVLDPINRDRRALRSGTEGVMFGRNRAHLVKPGQEVCKIAGKMPLKKAGDKLLGD